MIKFLYTVVNIILLRKDIFMIFETYSEQQTMKIAYDLAKKAKIQDVYCLTGDLGAGKTAFTKGFAEGLDIKEHITSPTFTIVNEYKDTLIPFYHFDVYRLSSPEEIFDLGFEDYFYGDGICLIEWADIIKEFLPDNAVWISITKDLQKGESYRLIEVLT